MKPRNPHLGTEKRDPTKLNRAKGGQSPNCSTISDSAVLGSSDYCGSDPPGTSGAAPCSHNSNSPSEKRELPAANTPQRPGPIAVEEAPLIPFTLPLAEAFARALPHGLGTEGPNTAVDNPLIRSPAPALDLFSFRRAPCSEALPKAAAPPQAGCDSPQSIGAGSPFRPLTSAAPLRQHDCCHYETCLDIAAALNWDTFTCSGCNREIDEQLLWRARHALKKDAVARLCCHLPEVGVTSSASRVAKSSSRNASGSSESADTLSPPPRTPLRTAGKR